MYTDPVYPKTEAQSRLLAKLEPLVGGFAARAAEHDRAGSFPFENFEELRACGYLAATVPEEYGGGEYGLTDVILAQLTIAEGDGSTALAVGMHLMTCGGEAVARAWPEELRARIFRAVVEDGALINNTAAEPEMGSPRGGGRPSTSLTADGPGRWRLNGHKTYTTLAPALTYLLTYATLTDAGDDSDVARIAVHSDLPGVRVVETWDVIGMRATASHDVYFEDVPVAERDFLMRHPLGRRGQPSEQSPWFPSLVAAASLGVAQAARDYAIDFARERKPTGYAAPIAEIPYVREQIGRMDAKLMAARALLLQTAEHWEQFPEARAALSPRIGAAKRLATNGAVEVVEIAMRIVGGQALMRSEPLERYLRDVRAGLVNPPIEARALEALAKAALGDSPTSS